MNVKAFLARFRKDTDDVVVPYFWSDAEILEYLNEAVDEACERAKLIEDRATTTVCNIATKANADGYTLHPSVNEIKRATFNGRVITETSEEALDDTDPGWESRKGTPTHYIYSPGVSLRLTPTPLAAGTVALTVYRNPLDPLTSNNDFDEPEIHPRNHLNLLHWLYRCAYLKHDSEVYNPVKSSEHDAQFEVLFGKRVGADVRRQQRDMRPPVVKFRW